MKYSIKGLFDCETKIIIEKDDDLISNDRLVVDEFNLYFIQIGIELTCRFNKNISLGNYLVKTLPSGISMFSDISTR